MRFRPAITAFFVSVSLFSLPGLAVPLEKIEARVDDEILTSTELELMLRPIQRQYAEMAGGGELTSLMEKARREAVTNWVERELILQETRTLEDLMVDRMEVERQFDEARNRFPSPEDFDDALAREGLDEKKFRKNLEDQFRVRALTYREVTSKVAVSPQAVMDYYQEHGGEFREAEMVRVSHILIPSPKDPAREEAALAEAEQLLAKLKEGADFAALAREYSQGPRAEQGGDIGYFGREEMHPQLEEAAFSIEVGENSGAIETDLGYHIIKVTAKKTPSRKSLTDAWAEIDDKLYREEFQKRYDQWIEKLEEKAHVVIEE